MMKLITELNEEVKMLTEQTEAGEQKYFIEGIFMQSEIKNKNGRIYPREVMMNEVNRYIKEYVEKNRAYGELNHPPGPQINMERVSHMITELRIEGNDVYGKAKIITGNPCGNIVKNIIKEGGSFGVSSRALGSLRESNGAHIVQGDFYLATPADIVTDPSAPSAFVRGIMEGREWVYEGGLLVERTVEDIKKEIIKTPAIRLDEVIIESFQRYVDAMMKGNK